MSNGRGDLPHPLNVWYPNAKRNEIYPISYFIKHYNIFIIIVSVTYTKFLYIDMTIALKSFNEMQQTASLRLSIILHDITVICYLLSNLLLFNAVISLDYGLPNGLHEMKFL